MMASNGGGRQREVCSGVSVLARSTGEVYSLLSAMDSVGGEDAR